MRDELKNQTVVLKRIARKKTGESYAHKKYIFSPGNDFVCEVPLGLAQKLMKTGLYIPVSGTKVTKKKLVPKSYTAANRAKMAAIKDQGIILGKVEVGKPKKENVKGSK